MNVQLPMLRQSRFLSATAIFRPITVLLAILTALASAPASAQPIMQVLELSREGALVTYSVGETGNGKAVVAMCDTCGEYLELDITPQTRLIVEDAEVPLAEHPTANEFRMTVFYLPDERRLTRMVATTPPR